MILANKLNITHQAELARVEEKISKEKARELFDSAAIDKVEIGTFAGLQFVHRYLFEDIYDFTGKLRDVNISKGNFRFAPVMYLEASLQNIDKMPHSNFDEFLPMMIESMIRRIIFIIAEDSPLHDEIEGQAMALREFFEVELVERLY